MRPSAVSEPIQAGMVGLNRGVVHDPAVTMFIGPAADGAPLEVGVVTDDDGTAVIHAMAARQKFLEGWWRQ